MYCNLIKPLLFFDKCRLSKTLYIPKIIIKSIIQIHKKRPAIFNMTGLLNVWSERQDLNLRPLHPQCSALPDCATPRWTNYFTDKNI